MRTTSCVGVMLALLAAVAWADGPQDNVATSVRRVPKTGIEVAPADRKELEKGLADLSSAIDSLATKGATKIAGDVTIAELLPDVRIYWKAVHDALTHQEFFTDREVTRAKEQLREGLQRAESLSAGQAPWTEQTGLVVRGYVSKIDGSVQPYGLVVPSSYSPKTSGRYRLDLWFHGRGENLSELNFLDERRRQAGQFTPADTIVLHPYGRYCNAFKFAGEVDVLEAIDAVRKYYRIDDDRISVRGFSMGGAACWQFAVHYADRWFAANPGAGFAETKRFLNVFQKETLQPTWYEQKLWHMYDCTDYAANLLQCPTVAYSGELDSQKQAADVMAEALEQEGITLEHVIGPATKHAYEPRAKEEVDDRMAKLAQRGRRRTPRELTLVTYTLKYNRMHWLTLEALGEHWKRARVHAKVGEGSTIALETENVRAILFDMPAGSCPFAVTRPVEITIDGTKVTTTKPRSDLSWQCRLQRVDGEWKLFSDPPLGVYKKHDLQGPIDDAFMGPFLFVRPTGTSRNPKLDEWVAKESTRAIEHWRRQFRGEALVRDDKDVSAADLVAHNIVLWGDPQSNSVLGKIANRLPIAWKPERIEVGDRSYDADHHALILICPSPMNPDRYVVLNSGFTYREYDYLNNARQVPKLPDWAVIDLNTPPDARSPGKVVDADFFGEAWELRPAARRTGPDK